MALLLKGGLTIMMFCIMLGHMMSSVISIACRFAATVRAWATLRCPTFLMSRPPRGRTMTRMCSLGKWGSLEAVVIRFFTLAGVRLRFSPRDAGEARSPCLGAFFVADLRLLTAVVHPTLFSNSSEEMSSPSTVICMAVAIVTWPIGDAERGSAGER